MYVAAVAASVTLELTGDTTHSQPRTTSIATAGHTPAERVAMGRSLPGGSKWPMARQGLAAVYTLPSTVEDRGIKSATSTHTSTGAIVGCPGADRPSRSTTPEAITKARAPTPPMATRRVIQSTFASTMRCDTGSVWNRGRTQTNVKKAMNTARMSTAPAT